MDQTKWMQLIASLAVLLLILPSVFYVFRQKTALRNAVIWLAIIAGLAWGYHLVVEQPAQKNTQRSLTTESTPAQETDSPTPAPETSDSPVRNL